MLFVCFEGGYSDCALTLVEHDDEEEALAVLRILEEQGGPEPVCSASAFTMLDETASTRPLVSVVEESLACRHEATQKSLFERLPLTVLRGAVDSLACKYEAGATTVSHEWGRLLRESLFLREQRDRIAVDLADMERIGAMTVETEAAPPPS